MDEVGEEYLKKKNQSRSTKILKPASFGVDFLQDESIDHDGKTQNSDVEQGRLHGEIEV